MWMVKEFLVCLYLDICLCSPLMNLFNDRSTEKNVFLAFGDLEEMS